MNRIYSVFISMYLLFGMVDVAKAITINHWITSPDIANVKYTETTDGNVQVAFEGLFDFASIGGDVEAFSGSFLYVDGAPPISSLTSDGVVHSFFSVAPLSFEMFGVEQNPLSGTVYVYDGYGTYSDGFYFQVTFDSYLGPGLSIPSTSYGLVSMGLNAGAYPPDVLTAAEVPRNLDVMAADTGEASFWAEVIPTAVSEPPLIMLFISGIAILISLSASGKTRSWTQANE